MSKAHVSYLTIYDCDRIKIVKDGDGRSVQVEFGDNGITERLVITAFRWSGDDNEPLAVEVFDANEVVEA